MTTFKNNIQRVNNSNSIVYDGDVYIEKDNGRGTIVKTLSDRKPGERMGYIEDGDRWAAINEPNGWLLEDIITFDFYANAYIKSRASLDDLTNEVACHIIGIRPDDHSKWANDLRTVLREYICNFDEYLENEDYFDNEEDLGDPDKLNKFLTGIIFDGICLYVDIYDIAEDIRAFKPYVNVTATENKGNVAKKTASYIIAALVVAGVVVVFFSLIGMGVFLLPLIGGAFTAK